MSSYGSTPAGLPSFAVSLTIDTIRERPELRRLPSRLFAAALLISVRAFTDSTAMREGAFGRSPSNYVSPTWAPPARAGIGTGTTSPMCCSSGGASVPTSSADFVYSDPRVMTPSITLPEPDPIPYPRYEATPAYPVVLPSGESPDPMEDLPKREEIEDYMRRQVTPTSETWWPEAPIGD